MVATTTLAGRSWGTPRPMPPRGTRLDRPVREEKTSVKEHPSQGGTVYAEDCVAKGAKILAVNIRTPDTWRPPVSTQPSCGMRGSAAGDRRFPLLLVGLKMDTTQQNLNTGDSPATESKIQDVVTIEDEEILENDKPLKLDAINDKVGEDAFKLLMSMDDNTNVDDSSNEAVALFDEQIPKNEEVNEPVNKPDDSYNPEEVWVSSDEDNMPPLPHARQRSGAARKKLKKLLNAQADGTTDEQPTASTSTDVSGEKRPHSNDGDAPEGSEPKQAKVEPVRDNVLVGILPSDFPETMFTAKQLKELQEAILDLIIEKRKEIETKPRFVRMRKRMGWLELTCANKATYQWLREIEHELKPWPGSSVRVVQANQIPYTEILTGKLLGSATYSNEKVLGLIEAQNEGLDVSQWKIVQRREFDSHLDAMFSMDHKSFETIKNANFQIGFKFGQIRLYTKSALAEKIHEQNARDIQLRQTHNIPTQQNEANARKPWQPGPQRQQGQQGLQRQQGQQRQQGSQRQQTYPWQTGPQRHQQQQGNPWQTGPPRQQQGLLSQRQRKRLYASERTSGQHRPGVGPYQHGTPSGSASSNASLSFSGQHGRRMSSSNELQRLNAPGQQFAGHQNNAELGTLPHSTNRNRSGLVWESSPFSLFRSPFQP